MEAKEYADQAVRWALEQMGSSKWSTLCYAFCEDAYELGGSILLDGQGATAGEAAAYYLPRAGCDPSALPPAGSYVFYACAGPLAGVHRDWGHMGLSLGDGRVVHAWDVVRVDTIRAVEALTPPTGWTALRYLGWCPPELVLVGVRTN